MSLKNVRYTRLETEESEGEEDETPPTHVEVNNESPHIKGSRWNHIDNLDEFFERVYEYHQKNGLAAIFVGDILELFQFLFIVVFTTFIVTCLRWDNLRADTITTYNSYGNDSTERDVSFSDLFDLSRFQRINFVVVIFLLMAFVFLVHRLLRAAVRLYRFWTIRNFFTDGLHISSSELRNTSWSDIVVCLKKAQTEYKMNIQKQELTELDVYHRILRFKNYMVAMVNKEVLPCKYNLPFYGEKIFFTHGLKFNYELILFWPSLKAPFKNSFYLREEYKSASKKHQLVQNLRFRITLLAFINLIFFPVIFLYQLLYSFFSYGELLKNQPGTFGRRRWSLYGRWHLRDFNELEHEFSMRLNRAYKPSVKYMDLFADPLMTLVCKNVAFVAGSLLAVLLVLTVLQEDLLTAPNILSVLTSLGLIITVCRLFIPSENQVWQPAGLMQRILGDVHYMPDHWKQQPHTVTVYREYTHVFQFTVMYVIDELLSPLITPFVLYFHLRNKSSDIIDFLRNFTIDVSGVGDVCSFAEMNIRKHGNPEWCSDGAGNGAATQYEQAELGKTEISLMHFSRKNPDWKPNEDGANFMSQLKQSVESMQQSYQEKPHPNSSHAHSDTSITYLHPPENSVLPSLRYFPDGGEGRGYGPPAPPLGIGGQQTASSDSMQWSIWSSTPADPHSGGALSAGQRQAGGGGGATGYGRVRDDNSLVASSYDTLKIHQLHDSKKISGGSSDDTSYNDLMNSDPTRPLNRPLNSLSSSERDRETLWTVPLSFPPTSTGGDVLGLSLASKKNELNEPLLLPPPLDTSTTELIQSSPDVFHSVEDLGGELPGCHHNNDNQHQEQYRDGYRQFAGTPETTVVELHDDDDDKH